LSCTVALDLRDQRRHCLAPAVIADSLVRRALA
jgi:hypothetical protein